MIPRPGETGCEWWNNVGAVQARVALGFGDFDERTHCQASRPCWRHDRPAHLMNGNAMAPPALEPDADSANAIPRATPAQNLQSGRRTLISPEPPRQRGSTGPE